MQLFINLKKLSKFKRRSNFGILLYPVGLRILSHRSHVSSLSFLKYYVKSKGYRAVSRKSSSSGCHQSWVQLALFIEKPVVSCSIDQQNYCTLIFFFYLMNVLYVEDNLFSNKNMASALNEYSRVV